MTVKLFNMLEVVVLSGVMNAVDAAGEVTLGELPESFVVVDGFASTSTAGTTNNELTVGDAGDPDRYVSDETFAAAALVGSAIDATGKGFKPTGANRTVVASNSGSAATPSSDITVTLTLVGYFDYS